MTSPSAPPLGLRPEKIYTQSAHAKLEELLKGSNRMRCEEILDAMKRYITAGEPVPREWFTELRRRTK